MSIFFLHFFLSLITMRFFFICIDRRAERYFFCSIYELYFIFFGSLFVLATSDSEDKIINFF